MNVRMMPPQGPMGQPMPQGGSPAPMGPPMGGPPPQMPMGGPMPQQSSGKGQGLGATFGGSAAGRGQFKQFMSSKKQQAPSMQVPQMPMASAMSQLPMLPPPMPTNMGPMKPMGAPNMGGGAPQLGRQAPVGGGIGSAPMGVASNTNAVRGFADGGSVPRQTEIAGQPHMLSYINPQEEAMLQKMRGGLPPLAGPGGVPAFAHGGFHWSQPSTWGGGSTTADTSSKDDDPPSNTFSQTLANIFTPSDGASYVGGQLVDDNTGSSISAGDTSSTGNVIAGTFANDSNNDDNSYIVSSNDTLSQIAEDNNMSVAEIMDANPDITNPDQIGIGQTLDLSGAGSGSDTYADGVGLGGIGSEADTSTDASQPEITTTVLGPDPTLTDVEKILIADYGWTDNGDGTLTNPYGGIYNDGPLQEEEDYTPTSDELNASLDAAGQINLTSDISEVDYSVTGSGQDYTTVAQSDTDSPTEFMMDQAVSDFYNQEDDTDFSLTSGDSRDDLSFDLTDPSEPLVTGNGVKFTGQYEGVTYVDGYPETEPLQVTIDESTYVPGQDTFESTFQANYGVSVPTTESEFMALSDAAKADLALLPSDEKQEILKEMSLNSGEDAPFDLRVINSIASVLGVRGIGDTFEYKIVESDKLADLLPPAGETTFTASIFTTDQLRDMYGDEFVDNYLSIPGGGGGGSGRGNEAFQIDEINELENNDLNADHNSGR